MVPAGGVWWRRLGGVMTIAGVRVNLLVVVAVAVLLLCSLAAGAITVIGEGRRTASGAGIPTPRTKPGENITSMYDHWESLTQLQRTSYEREVIGRVITERCDIDDVRKDGRVDLDCGQRGLQMVMLYGVPPDQAAALTKGKQYAFTAKVRSLRVALTNDLTLDWVSSP